MADVLETNKGEVAALYLVNTMVLHNGYNDDNDDQIITRIVIISPLSTAELGPPGYDWALWNWSKYNKLC